MGEKWGILRFCKVKIGYFGVVGEGVKVIIHPAALGSCRVAYKFAIG